MNPLTETCHCDVPAPYCNCECKFCIELNYSGEPAPPVVRRDPRTCKGTKDPCNSFYCMRCVREQSGEYPDCDKCYLAFNPLVGNFTEFPCSDHRDEYLDKLKASLAKKESRGRPKAGAEDQYAFTLTMPPDYKHPAGKSIVESVNAILNHGITAAKPYEKPDKWAYVLEHTDKGTPHIHGVYHTPSGRRISAKYFKRYWPLWDETKKMGHGHQGGYHAKARHSESYDAYMSKEGVVVSNPAPTPELIHIDDEPELISHDYS